MSISIGKSLGKLVEGAKQAVSNVEKTVANDAKKVAQAADVFEQGFVKPLLNLGQPTPAHAEPALMAGDGGTVAYQNVSGKLVVDGVQPGDVKQGQIGDCYFLSSLAAVAGTHPELIQNAISANADGTYAVQFHEIPGIDGLRALGMAGAGAAGYVERAVEKLGARPTGTTTVQTDGALPESNGREVYAHDPNKQELWPQLMEKAFAKAYGGYTAIGEGGTPATALTALTGAKVDHVKTSGSTDALWTALSQASAAKQPMVTSTGKTAPAGVTNLVTNHAYSVLGTKVENGQRYVIVRNPWGNTEPSNAQADGKNDGVFSIKVEDFAQSFTGGVDIART